MQVTYNERIKMKNKWKLIKMKNFSFLPADKAKIKFKWTFFFLFAETWLASSMKTLKLKALWYKHEKMLIQFFEGVSSEHISLKIHNLGTVWQ